MATTTTARKFSYRKSNVAGWEVFDFATDQVVTVVKNRDQARDAIKQLAANPEAVDATIEVVDQVDPAETTEREPVTGDQVRTSPVFADLSDEARETVAANADAAIEAMADADPGAGVAIEDGKTAEETADPKPAKATKARKTAKAKTEKAPKAPKAAKEPKAPAPNYTGEVTVTRKLETGQLINLKGVGVVKVVNRVKLDGQKFEVEYERVADGEYGSAAMWANSRFRLVAPTA